MEGLVGLHDLCRDILQAGCKIRVHIVGHCMSPLLEPGEIIIVEPIRIDQAHVGDVILYQKNTRLEAHRLLRKSSSGGRPVLITKGDNHGYFDLAVQENQVLGRVISVEKSDRFLALEGNVGRYVSYLYCMASWYRAAVSWPNPNGRLAQRCPALAKAVQFAQRMAETWLYRFRLALTGVLRRLPRTPKADLSHGLEIRNDRS